MTDKHGNTRTKQDLGTSACCNKRCPPVLFGFASQNRNVMELNSSVVSNGWYYTCYHHPQFAVAVSGHNRCLPKMCYSPAVPVDSHPALESALSKTHSLYFGTLMLLAPIKTLAKQRFPYKPAYWAAYRCYSAEKQEGVAEPLSFLKPNINPHGIWGAAQKEPQKPGDDTSSDAQLATTHTPKLWSLAERRAVFLYARAIEVHRKREPDWSIVGQRMGRDPRQCRFTYYYVRKNWARYRSKSISQLSNVDAGVTANELMRLADSSEKEDMKAQLIQKHGWDQSTMQWLDSLASSPEPALAEPCTKRMRTKWTAGQDIELMDMCPLYRALTNDELQGFMYKHGRTLAAVRVHLSVLLKNLGGLSAGEIRPLSSSEQKIIAYAADQRKPDAVRFRDVKEQLSTRSFAELMHLTKHNATKAASTN